jgi:hypothetical protein
MLFNSSCITQEPSFNPAHKSEWQCPAEKQQCSLHKPTGVPECEETSQESRRGVLPVRPVCVAGFRHYRSVFLWRGKIYTRFLVLAIRILRASLFLFSLNTHVPEADVLSSGLEALNNYRVRDRSHHANYLDHSCCRRHLHATSITTTELLYDCTPLTHLSPCVSIIDDLESNRY